MYVYIYMYVCRAAISFAFFSFSFGKPTPSLLYLHSCRFRDFAMCVVYIALKCCVYIYIPGALYTSARQM